MARLLVVALLLAGFALASAAYRRWRAGLHAEQRPHPPLPADLLGDAERTWVVFTTPLCASCGPVEEHLRRADPAARVVKVDATRQPDLASAFHVRSAPTVLLADIKGVVQARLVGAEAVTSFLPV